MPFGLTNAPATCQELVNDTLKEFLDKTVIIVPEKCEFYKKEVKFLGFIIGTNGIKIDPDKTRAVQEWLIPKTVKEV
ncbi:MAG: hypothetical protein FE78DRAFT_29023 [Acidomyces sp. 'richmondensis']|nr:MAG: hypothetical protein FE78DRAFT_29023 [Acidomyces sp. 'richmondensis']